MLKIKDMNLNSVIRQGDSQPREYQLDTGNLNLNLTNKRATIRLMTGDYKGIAYETTATVSSENKISFSIDDIIPAREYRLEITVDDYVFPSRATDGRFDIDPSSHGQEVNIIQVIGKDEIVREVKEQIEPFLGEIEQAELDRQAAEHQREANELVRTEGMVKLENLVPNGDFSEGEQGWSPINGGSISDGKLKLAPVSLSGAHTSIKSQNVGDKIYLRLNVSDNTLNSELLVSSTTYSQVQALTMVSLPIGFNGDFSNVVSVIRATTMFSISRPTGGSPSGTANVDDVMTINLTQAFGAGNEPNKEEMDTLMQHIGYFNGELLLSKKELLYWHLKLIRQNRNAIIALGGEL